MGNAQSKNALVPQISPEMARNGISNRLAMTFEKRVTLKTHLFLADPNSGLSFAAYAPYSGAYNVILYDGPDASCPVLATAKGIGKWKKDFRVCLPSFPGETLGIREELLRSCTVSTKRETYWFGMQVGEDQPVERFEWRQSRGREVKSMGARAGWKLVRLGGGLQGLAEENGTQGSASDGEIVAVWARDDSWSPYKIGEMRFLGSGATGEFGRLWELMVVVSFVCIWCRHT
ncbi:hypothetical protein CEP53_000517 [Fusarium sp. AF-6]|nr:hypothetical protein CEP53_000517 [Fusarium sp. AF-6]